MRSPISRLRAQIYRKQRSGQSVVFEQVLLFGVGVALFAVFVAVFSLLRGIWSDQAAGDKLDAVTHQVTGAILQAASDPSDAERTLAIPTEIVGEPYKVELTGGILQVSTQTGAVPAAKQSQLFQLKNAYTLLDSAAWSVRGVLTVKKAGSTISIV